MAAAARASVHEVRRQCDRADWLQWPIRGDSDEHNGRCSRGICVERSDSRTLAIVVGAIRALLRHTRSRARLPDEPERGNAGKLKCCSFCQPEVAANSLGQVRFSERASRSRSEHSQVLARSQLAWRISELSKLGAGLAAACAKREHEPLLCWAAAAASSLCLRRSCDRLFCRFGTVLLRCARLAHLQLEAQSRFSFPFQISTPTERAHRAQRSSSAREASNKCARARALYSVEATARSLITSTC